jgi:hypothetical protein
VVLSASGGTSPIELSSRPMLVIVIFAAAVSGNIVQSRNNDDMIWMHFVIKIS